MLRLTTVIAILLSAACSLAQEPSSAPSASRPRLADSVRLNDLLSVIEGPNTLQARRTSARELLRQGWSETPARLAAVLSGTSRLARMAVAQALAETRDYLDVRFVEPLVAMLRDEEAESRQAAAAALAAYGSADVVARIETLLQEAAAPQTAKLAAIEAIGSMTNREAVRLLVDLTADTSSALCRPAIAALERATAQEFGHDPSRVQDWWRGARDSEPAVWQRLQIDRLSRQADVLSQRVRELETRLTASLRETYLRTAEAERPALLASFLNDSTEAARLLGLEIVQSQLAEGRSPPVDLVALCRNLILAPEPRVRAAAVRAVANLRAADDAGRFATLLSTEVDLDVRLALLYALGCTGGSDAVRVLVSIAASPDPMLADEAVASLGRLGERGSLEGALRDQAVATLLERARVAGGAGNGRERILRAMARIGDPRFAPALFAATEPQEPAAIRVAGLRGLTTLVSVISTNGHADSQPTSNGADGAIRPPTKKSVGEALIAAAIDQNLQVRRAAIESLATIADSDAHLQALWAHLAAPVEPDEAVRNAAWRGCLAYLTGRPKAELLTAIERLPADEPARTQRALDLYLLIEKALLADGNSRVELGGVRAKIGALRGAQNQPAEAIAAYLAALDDLTTGGAGEARAVAVELLCFSLSQNRYDSAIAEAIKPERTKLDVAGSWSAIQPIIQARLTPAAADAAISMLTAYQQHPPAPLTPEIQQAVEAMLHEARDMQAQTAQEEIILAIAALRKDPASESASQRISKYGGRAATPLRNALLALLAESNPDAACERALIGLLRAAQPDWTGYRLDAPEAEKRKLLEAPGSQPAVNSGTRG